jgi:hypothetical protein
LKINEYSILTYSENRCLKYEEEKREHERNRGSVTSETFPVLSVVVKDSNKSP